MRRHKAGTLGEDVRGEMLQQVVQEGWSYGANIEFDTLASRPQFRGHTRASLCHLFNGMRLNTMNKLPGVKSVKEVTVEQVEEWWGSKLRKEKSKRLVEKEEGIVEAYQRLRGGSGTLYSPVTALVYLTTRHIYIFIPASDCTFSNILCHIFSPFSPIFYLF